MFTCYGSNHLQICCVEAFKIFNSRYILIPCIIEYIHHELNNCKSLIIIYRHITTDSDLHKLHVVTSYNDCTHSAEPFATSVIGKKE